MGYLQVLVPKVKLSYKMPKKNYRKIAKNNGIYLVPGRKTLLT